MRTVSLSRADDVTVRSVDDVTVDVAIEVDDDGQAALVVPDAAPPVTLRFAARSDVGLVRAGNEDSGYAGPRLLVVADGMGGHAAGELASAVAIATVADLDVHPPSSSELLNALTDAIDSTGETINAIINEEPDLTGMGTTVTGLYWLGSRVALVHVGDSRAYLFRDHELVQLTHDHTYVQTLVDAGRITEEQAATHPKRSLLMRALDGMNPVEADLSVREARTGDRYLLCSDGLSGVVDSADIAGALTMSDPTGCVTRLVDLALEARCTGQRHQWSWRTSLRMRSHQTEHRRRSSRPSSWEPRVNLGCERNCPACVSPTMLNQILTPRGSAAGGWWATDGSPAFDRRRDRGARGRTGDARSAGRGPTQNPARASLEGGRHLRRPHRGDRRRDVRGSHHRAGVVAIPVVRRGQRQPRHRNGRDLPGVPGNLAGVSLSTLTTDTGLPAGQLPLFDQELVSKGIPAESEADAQRIVTELQVRADECQTIFPPAGCPGSLSNEPVEDAP